MNSPPPTGHPTTIPTAGSTTPGAPKTSSSDSVNADPTTTKAKAPEKKQSTSTQNSKSPVPAKRKRKPRPKSGLTTNSTYLATNPAVEHPTDIGALLAMLKSRLTLSQVDQIHKAYQHAERAHRGQFRKSGEPYITHPLAVASIVANMNLDAYSIICALLHDVLEDTPTTKEDLTKEFGEEIADIVDGLSKLNYLEFKTKEEAQAESFRKMLLAMVSDIRVILIKLADRLHNMRTLGSMLQHKQRRIALETLEVYSPIAHRLGMYSVKNELEDLGFRYAYPWRSRILEMHVEEAHKNRHHVIEKLVDKIKEALDEVGIKASVRGREKHLYSLYRKMRQKQLSFQEVFDMFAMRVVVNSVDECYRTLGICHNLYKPYPRKFKDYIAVPKENSYQSLHTVLAHSDVPVEVQIRTQEMDEFAESGVAAHWVYKDGEVNSAQHKTRQWLTSLLDMQRSSDNVHEFIEHVKVDLYPGEIYVFTPKGRIIQLPASATPVDFAYAVHSQVGSSCVAAKVDRRLVSLSTVLKSGQTVEILTSTAAKPSPMWLNFVVSAKARSAIRHHLRDLDHEKAVEFGERLINRALSRYEMHLEQINERGIKLLLKEFHYKELSELFADVGMGNHLPSLIAERLMQKHSGDSQSDQVPVKESTPLLIEGREGTVLSLSKCCRPIPGDNVQGLITAGKGIAVHRAGCRNIRRFRRRAREWVAVEWAAGLEGDFEAMILVNLENQPGALARISTVLSSLNANIEGIDFHNKGENNINIHFLLSLRDRRHLARIIRRIRNLPVVVSVKRI